jgi:lipoyl(octanoyl) transferase
MEARLSPAEGLAARAVWNDRVCQVSRLGHFPYLEAWALQRQLAECRKAGEIPDQLLLLEHPPVITIGRNARPEHILSDSKELERDGIQIVETNRGGDVTFHGPGQLVGYPILDLSRIRKDVVWYVRTLEEALIRLVNGLGLEGSRRAGMTGVWVGDSKVAAIGIHISRWITSHGFALNVATDLRYYRHIVPCGISAYPVSSLQQLLGANVDRSLLENNLAENLGQLLGREITWSSETVPERRESCLPPM